MRAVNLMVFNDFISGTGSFWYSSAEFNGPLGECDLFALQAMPTNVTGTTPQLGVTLETSSDNQNWSELFPTPQIGDPLASDLSVYGYQAPQNSFPRGFVRARINLYGTAPACHLKLYITGRVLGA